MLLSNAPLPIDDPTIKELLTKFFLTAFSNATEFNSFTFSNGDISLNPVYSFCKGIFHNKDEFHLNSVNLAKHLYEVSDHPQIKKGDLFVAIFNDLRLNDQPVRAIGIFKSENRQPFLRLDQDQEGFSVSYEDGINVEKLDKGCLVFEVDEEDGYKVCIVDKSNRSAEAQYWKDNFLMISPCKDEYHQTKDFLSIAKNYVTKKLVEDFEVNRTEQLEVLNRSIEYFKSHDTFKKDEFEEQVFQHPEVINSFRRFDEEYRESRSIEVEDEFDISDQAVKKQSKIFKSVLKLDRNFHIYIHGDRSLIEQGKDADGRKYYKIYFDQEA